MSENEEANPTNSADATGGDPIKLAQEFGLAGFGVPEDESNARSSKTPETRETQELVELARSVGLDGY